MNNQITEIEDCLDEVIIDGTQTKALLGNKFIQIEIGEIVMAMDALVNYVIGIVVVLAVLSAMWGTITGFVTCITVLSGASSSVAQLAGLISFFIILAVVLAIIYGALKTAKSHK